MLRPQVDVGLPGDNRYGQLTARSGLAVVADLFVTTGWRTWRRVSGFSGAELLQLEGPGLALESDAVPGPCHFIGGEVEPSEPGRASLRHVSACLAEAGIAHRLELYVPETNRLLDYHEHGWCGADAW